MISGWVLPAREAHGAQTDVGVRQRWPRGMHNCIVAMVMAVIKHIMSATSGLGLGFFKQHEMGEFFSCMRTQL